MSRHSLRQKSAFSLLGVSLLPLLLLGLGFASSGCSSTVEGKGGGDGTGGATGTGGKSGDGGSASDGGSTSSDGGSTSGDGGTSTGDGGSTTGTGGTANTGGGPNYPVPPSCDGLELNCGKDGNDDCCASIAIDPEPFLMGRSTNGDDAFASGDDDETPEHTSTPISVRLDKYEVTVGRFRKFVEAYEAGYRPGPGIGNHPGHDDDGWSSAWDDQLDEYLTVTLKCENRATWYDQPSTVYGDSEVRPINCVTWFYAFAFCAWDGGFLPSELDWEFAAAGGEENRLYPWGNEAPAQTRASSDCMHDGNFVCGDPANTPPPDGYNMLIDIPAVGTLPDGAGRFGHLDLAGGMAEWVLDAYDATYYQGTSSGCTNCLHAMPKTLAQTTQGTIRGGSWDRAPEELRAAARHSHDLTGLDENDMGTGFRCARPL